MNFENFIDDFIETKIDVMVITFKNDSSYISEMFKKLRVVDVKTPENVGFSIQIIQAMVKNYSSYTCLNTVGYMERNDFFSDIHEDKKELFLKKITWFIYTMYEVEGNSCGWAYYDDAGIQRNIITSFKESREKEYSQKMEDWDINQ